MIIELSRAEGIAHARSVARDAGDVEFEIMAGQIERGEANASLCDGEFTITSCPNLHLVQPVFAKDSK